MILSESFFNNFDDFSSPLILKTIDLSMQSINSALQTRGEVSPITGGQFFRCGKGRQIAQVVVAFEKTAGHNNDIRICNISNGKRIEMSQVQYSDNFVLSLSEEFLDLRRPLISQMRWNDDECGFGRDNASGDGSGIFGGRTVNEAECNCSFAVTDLVC